MGVKKNLLTASFCVAIAILVAFMYPESTQYFFVKVIFHAKKVEYEYWHLAHPEKSAGARAIEDLLRMRPEPPLNDITGMRKQLDTALAALFPLPASAIVEKVKIKSGVKAFWITPSNVDAKNESCPIILYVHGGSFVSGSFKSYGGFVSEIARRAHARAFFVQYRLAPAHPLPAATDDVLDAYKYLLRQGMDYNRIVMVGDSAGGGLVLLSLHAMQRAETLTAFPRLAITFSAWTDLYSSPVPRASYLKNKDRDAILKAHWLQHRALVATGTNETEFEKRRLPEYSAINGALPKPNRFPALLMQVGSEEILADDTIQYAERVKRFGANVTLSVSPGMQHVSVIFWDYFDEASKSLDEAVNWMLKSYYSKGPLQALRV